MSKERELITIDFYRDTFIHVFMPEFDDETEYLEENSVLVDVPLELCNEWYSIAGGFDEDNNPVESFEEWHRKWSLLEEYDSLLVYAVEHGYGAVLVEGNPDILYQGAGSGIYKLVKR